MKSILLKVNLKGKGVVNFDSGDQKWLFHKTNLNHLFTSNNNVKYAKKNLYKDADGNLYYKLKISSNCLKHGIFKDDVFAQSSNIMYYDSVLYPFIASPMAVLRGYMCADLGFKKKGQFVLTDAEQTNNAVSFLNMKTKSGQKEVGLTPKEKTDDKDTSLFNEETVGDITYSAKGVINLNELQFVSCDDIFDRYAFNPDMFDFYKKFMQMNLKSFNSELGYYRIKKSKNLLPEYGFRFSNEDVTTMVVDLLKDIQKLSIGSGNGGLVDVESIEYKIVNDAIADTYDNPSNWVKIVTENDINSINIILDDYYIPVDSDEASKVRVEYEKLSAEFKAKKSAEKAAKTADAKAKKNTKKSEDNE